VPIWCVAAELLYVVLYPDAIGRSGRQKEHVEHADQRDKAYLTADSVVHATVGSQTATAVVGIVFMPAGGSCQRCTGHW
jgi:hypothetical protein